MCMLVQHVSRWVQQWYAHGEKVGDTGRGGKVLMVCGLMTYWEIMESYGRLMRGCHNLGWVSKDQQTVGTVRDDGNAIPDL